MKIVERISKRRLKAIIGGSIGNLVEWYDWYAYAAFTIYFSSSFFPDDNDTVRLMNTAAIFAVGFLMRPLGGYVFGVIGDRFGRKKSMTLSVLLMSFGSLIIAFTPTYSQIGLFAPFVLLIARLLQGLSVGGEYGVSATYLSEMATPARRGFYSSFQYVTLIGGQLLALGIQLLLQKVLLSEAEIVAWGWRIPFFIGAVLAVVALYLRRHLDETKAFQAQKKSTERPKHSLLILLQYPKQILVVVGLTLGGTLAFYTYSTYMQKFLVNTAGFPKQDATWITFVALFVFACLQPVFGILSDKIGRRPLLMGFGILGVLTTVPILTTLESVTNKWQAFWLILAALIIVSGYTSINAIVKAELFPAKIRALGVGLPYALTVAIFGGSAEYVALKFKDLGHERWFYWYVTWSICCSLFVYVAMKDTKETSRLNEEPNG